jgi:hypothetical protein
MYMEDGAGCHEGPGHRWHVTLYAEAATVHTRGTEPTMDRSAVGIARVISDKSPATHFTVQDLAMIRATVLRVIDDGNPKHPDIKCVRKKEWYLWSYQEETANQERLEFCDAICAKIIEAAGSVEPKVRMG